MSKGQRAQAGAAAITRRSALVGLSASATLATLGTARVPSGETGEAIVATGSGRLRGLRRGGVNIFKGIRYGAPPMGERRFMPPLAPRSWSGTADALTFGASAIQLPAYPTAEDLPASGSFWSHLIGTQPAESEDCLFLNVWTPGTGDGRSRPIMVWLHGGAYLRGAGTWAAYDGEHLARDHDVVVVTVNHRLNTFGFLDLSGFDPRYEASGNVGMLDLVAALGWVRDNAEGIGGDARNVTIFGESGGAGKVGTLMTMPAAEGLFHKAVMQSPAAGGATPDQASETTAALLRELDIAPAEARRIAQVPVDSIRQAALRVMLQAAKEGKVWPLNVWRPVVDGRIVPVDLRQGLGRGNAGQIPLLIGTNAFELTTLAFYFGLGNDQVAAHRNMGEAELHDRLRAFARYDDGQVNQLVGLYRAEFAGETPYDLLFRIGTDLQMRCRAIDTVEERQRDAAAPTFMYGLDWQLPAHDGVWRTPHGLDVPFVFDNADRFPDLLGSGDTVRELSRAMSGAWSSFARTGIPTVPGGPAWLTYDPVFRHTMIFDVHSPNRLRSGIGRTQAHRYAAKAHPLTACPSGLGQGEPTFFVYS